MKPTKYKSEFKDNVLSVESRQDKSGEVYFYITYSFGDSEVYCRFSSMTSVVDFIRSNF